MNLKPITRDTLEMVVRLLGEEHSDPDQRDVSALRVRKKLGIFLPTSNDFPDIKRIEDLKNIEEAMSLYRELFMHQHDILERLFFKKLADLIQAQKQ